MNRIPFGVCCPWTADSSRKQAIFSVADGVSHPLTPGTACFLGYDVKHELINESTQDDLVMLWVITPHGLENFFEAIGRPRSSGDPAPVPFERPTDVIAIERRLGMNDTK